MAGQPYAHKFRSITGQIKNPDAEFESEEPFVDGEIDSDGEWPDPKNAGSTFRYCRWAGALEDEAV